MRILIADNDQLFLEVIQSYLSTFGHDVATTTNALDCANALRDFYPDLLLLEQDLPRGRSARGVSQMLADFRPADIAVILVSDCDKPTEFSNGFSKFITGWIEKPFRLEDLLICIDSSIPLPSKSPQRLLHASQGFLEPVGA